MGGSKIISVLVYANFWGSPKLNQNTIWKSESICICLFLCLLFIAEFLTARVSKSEEDDCWKLKLLLKYLNNTNHMKLTLSVEVLSVIHWWVDSAYLVHHNFKEHTIAMM